MLENALKTIGGFGAAAAAAYKDFNAPTAADLVKAQTKANASAEQQKQTGWLRIAIIGGAVLAFIAVLALVLRRS